MQNTLVWETCSRSASLLPMDARRSKRKKLTAQSETYEARYRRLFPLDCSITVRFAGIGKTVLFA